MQVEYEDEELDLLAHVATHYTARWSPNVTKAYRRRIQQLEAATDEQDLRALKSLHFEKLRGDRDGTYSIRIDMQYRIILRFDIAAGEKLAVVIEAVDYH